MQSVVKLNFFVALFNGLLLGVVLTIAGGLLNSGSVDWANFLVTVLVGVVVGVVVGMIIPLGKMASALADKLAKPGSIVYTFLFNSVTLLVMLIFMSPFLTIFIGSILYGAPIGEVIPNSYDFFLPFYLIGIPFLMILGKPIMNLAKRCAGIPHDVDLQNS